MKMNGTGGGSENSEHQKLPRYSQVTCAEIAGKQQEEDFAGGLPARNARVLPYRACPDPRAWRQSAGGSLPRTCAWRQSDGGCG